MSAILCPSCRRKFKWSACEETYIGTNIERGQISKTNHGLNNHRAIELEVCPNCNTVIAVKVFDSDSRVYVADGK
jgi:uncharacterized protein with PIN domain